MIIFLQVAGGLILLFVGGEFLVRAAVTLAQRLGVSPLVIGLSVVAAGTSAPELLVSLLAAFEGAPGIAFGNVVGSNIANILLVLGAAGLVSPLIANKKSAARDGGAMLAATVLFIGLALSGAVARWHGVVMLACLIVYLLVSYYTDRKDQAAAAELEEEIRELASDREALWLTILKLVLGFAGIMAGSELLVDGAVSIAKSAGVSDTVIGITLVAVGTSLPELAASLIAAKNRHTDVALGNAVGSCIFNILAILGTVALVHPMKVPPELLAFDVWVMLGVSVVFLAMALTLPRLGWIICLMMLALYLAYTVQQFTGPAARAAAPGKAAALHWPGDWPAIRA